MGYLVCSKCLKPVSSIITSAVDASLYCQCNAALTISISMTNGTVTTSYMEPPFKSKRASVPVLFQEAFKDGELEL